MNSYIFDVVGWTLMAAVMLLCAAFWYVLGSLVAEGIKKIWHMVCG